MIEEEVIKIEIIMKSGRQYKCLVSNNNINWLYDKLFGRVVGDFQI